MFDLLIALFDLFLYLQLVTLVNFLSFLYFGLFQIHGKSVPYRPLDLFSELNIKGRTSGTIYCNLFMRCSSFYS